MIPPINNVRVSVIADDLESDVSVVSHGAQATTDMVRRFNLEVISTTPFACFMSSVTDYPQSCSWSDWFVFHCLNSFRLSFRSFCCRVCWLFPMGS